MSVIHATEQTFAQEIANGLVLVDFYADWCGPCKMFSPIIESVANENEDVKVVKINVDNAQDLAIKYQVMSIPTTVIIQNGKEVDRAVGIISKSDLLEMVK